MIEQNSRTSVQGPITQQWKEQTADTHNSMKESLLHFAKWKMPDSKATYLWAYLCVILEKSELSRHQW